MLYKTPADVGQDLLGVIWKCNRSNFRTAVNVVIDTINITPKHLQTLHYNHRIIRILINFHILLRNSLN